MSRTLDFNAIQQPTLDLTMKDEARTVVRVSVPTEGFVEEMQALEPLVKKMQKEGNSLDTFKQLYGFFAKVLSHNEDRLVITAEDLRDKFKLTLLDLFALHGVYMDFIDDLKNAKN